MQFQLIVFMGLQASGKTSYYIDNFMHSHLHVSLDVLKTRPRERRLVDLCLGMKQSMVIDNTNLSKADRARYIEGARDKEFAVHGYYFSSKIKEALARNSLRIGKKKVPDVAILASSKRLQLPAANEGFDKLFYVSIVDGKFVTKEWDGKAKS